MIRLFVPIWEWGGGRGVGIFSRDPPLTGAGSMLAWMVGMVASWVPGSGSVGEADTGAGVDWGS